MVTSLSSIPAVPLMGDIAVGRGCGNGGERGEGVSRGHIVSYSLELGSLGALTALRALVRYLLSTLRTWAW